MEFFDVFALIILTVLLVTTVGIVIWLAMLPGKVAAKREHPQAEAINVAGWLGILTGIVWVLAMIWAYARVGEGVSAQRIREIEDRLAALEGRDAEEGASS